MESISDAKRVSFMYLVTGGSGFCGVEIVRYLLEKGQRVRVLDIEEPPSSISGIDFVRVDIRDKEQVDKACLGVDKIIHTAAKVPISKAGKGFWEVNVEGTRNILASAQKNRIKKVVHISSSAVQLSEHNPVAEDAPYNSVGLYARTKMEGEKVCKEFINQGLCIDIIRPRTVVGAGRLGIFGILFEWISEGKKIYILGEGQNRVQFLHSKDLASCCYLSSLNQSSNIFNVGSRNFSSLRQDLGGLICYAKSPSRIVSLPVWPCIATLALLDQLHLSPLASWHYLTYHKDFHFDNVRAKQELGWEPEYGNQEILITAYRDYLENIGERGPYGTSHRKTLRQGLLKLIKIFS